MYLPHVEKDGMTISLKGTSLIDNFILPKNLGPPVYAQELKRNFTLIEI